jgi:hypothetical protein
MGSTHAGESGNENIQDRVSAFSSGNLQVFSAHFLDGHSLADADNIRLRWCRTS